MLATDGDSDAQNTPIWSIRQRGARGEVQRIRFSGSSPRRAEFDVRLGTPSPLRTLDVAVWNSEPAVFEMRLQPRGVATRVRPVAGGGTTAAVGFAEIPEPRAAFRRVAIATWSGRLPDLFVIDHLAFEKRMRVSVFSGESAFTQLVDQMRASFVGLDPRQWAFDVGALYGGRPDLIGFRHAGAPSGLPEVHVLSGETRFRTFSLQGTLRAADEGYAPRVLSGVSGRAPSAFLIDGSRVRPVHVGLRRTAP